jgi:acetyl esterase/lipase
VSSHDAISPMLVTPFLSRGYTTFAVVHGSQPRFQIPEIVEDVNRAVRFIRHHAADYGIDPNRLGVCGASAGGHLSLMIGTAGTPGDPKARDPVDRESSRVQAVACFFPPTDLLNYGKPGVEKIHPMDHNRPFRPAFDYRAVDPVRNLWVPITDEAKLRQIARDISPVYHVSPDDPPTFIMHGDADDLVPIQQSREIVAALEKAGVAAELVVKPQAGHGWLTIAADLSRFADWFDRHLGAPAAGAKPATSSATPVPQVDGPWWPIAGNPDLGPLTGETQQPVDFAVWQARNGTWQLWSCVRGTKCGGKTRLFHRWEGPALTTPDWTPKGIAWRAEPDLGETAGGLQAPHVIRWNGRDVMLYGDWQHIALATSDDGKTFTRRLGPAGTVGLFDEGPSSNTRDPMGLVVGDRLLCYYTAYPAGRGAVYCRSSDGDLTRWSDPRSVASGGQAGTGPSSSECPFVVNVDGWYYLFRTHRYGRDAKTSVYRSRDPLDFGNDDDRDLVTTLPVAAPELVRQGDAWYIAALNSGLDGIRMARLKWVPRP